jgi:hypothetical protein
MTDSSRAINRVFTFGVVRGLLQTGSNEIFKAVVQRYINDPESKTHGEIISEIYTYLGEEQRNEYYYMNTLLNKLLAGIHNVNTTTALSKVRVGQAIADFIMINGEGKIYEIKSELDNFARLHDQLLNYYKAFSKVSVLSSEQDVDKLEQILVKLGRMGDAVGIYGLSNNDTIFNKRYTREPKPFEDCLDHTCIFKLLRKSEYENILRRHFGMIPEVAPVFHFRACLEYFKQLDILVAQKFAFTEMKKRNRIQTVEFNKIQPELKSVIYFSGLAQKLPSLEHLLQTRYAG